MTASTVPQPAGFFHPILRVLDEKPEGLRRRDIYEPVADLAQLTPAQRAERLPSGAHLRYRHRIGWSLNMLKLAGDVESPSSGLWRITDKGRELLAANPEQLSEAMMRKIEK